MGSLASETQILYFWNNYFKWVFKNYTMDLQPDFPLLWELRVQILKNYEDKAKRPLLTFVSMSPIYPISIGMFPSQSTPKALFEP